MRLRCLRILNKPEGSFLVPFWQYLNAMHLDDHQHTLMSAPRSRFPLAEGMGVFLGVIAWDLLSEGYVGITKALLVAVPVSLLWFGIRCWKDRRRKK